MAGDLVLYSADNRNVHCVDEITDGERLTLTLWFSRNNSFDEDVKLISLAPQAILTNDLVACIPLPASSNMYWYSSDQGSSDQLQGFDIRFSRLLSLGFDIFSAQGNAYYEVNSTTNIYDVFDQPLKLAGGDKLFSEEFANLLQALQAVHFYYWNQPYPQQSDVRNTGGITLLSEAQKQDVLKLRRCLLSGNMELDARIFGYSSSSSSIKEPHFDWDCFSASVKSLEEYTSKLHEQLTVHLPLWKEYRSLFSISSAAAKE